MDLSLILLDDIIIELKKRLDSFIFSYVNDLDSKEEEVNHYFHGGRMRCIGLTEQLKHALLNDEEDTD